MSYHVLLIVSVNECVYLTLTSAFVEGAVLLYTSICSLPSRNFSIFVSGEYYVLFSGTWVSRSFVHSCSKSCSEAGMFKWYISADIRCSNIFLSSGDISFFPLLCLSFQKYVISSFAKLFICTIYNLIYIHVEIMFKVTVVMKPTVRLAVQIWSHVSHFPKSSWKPGFCCIWHYQCPFQNKQYQSLWTSLFAHSWF